MLNIPNPREFSRSSPSCRWPSSKTAAPPLTLDSLLTLTEAGQHTVETSRQISVISNE